MHMTFRLPPIYLLYCAAMISQQLELLQVINLEHTHTSAWLSQQFPDRHAHVCSLPHCLCIRHMHLD